MENRSSYGMLLVAGLVALGAVGVAVLTSHTSASEAERSENVSLVAPNQEKNNADTDGDGVPDWKEILWRTDPYNPDTDGDGISDAEEIADGTLPTSPRNMPLARTYVAPPSLPTTEAVARELFANYITSKEAGVLDTTAFNDSLSNTLDRHVSIESSATAYTLADVNIDPSVSVEVYEEMLTEVLVVLGQINEYELITFSRVVENENRQARATLSLAATVYREVERDLALLSVPEALGVVHLRTLTGMALLADATQRLSEWNRDPVTALSLTVYFRESEQLLTEALTELFLRINTFSP